MRPPRRPRCCRRCIRPADVAAAQGGGARKVAAAGPRGLEKLQQMLDSSEKVVLRLVVKADVQGSIEALQKAHPDVPIHVAQIDSHLNDIGFIVPGLGDAGDRQFGTA